MKLYHILIFLLLLKISAQADAEINPSGGEIDGMSLSKGDKAHDANSYGSFSELAPRNLIAKSVGKSMMSDTSFPVAWTNLNGVEVNPDNSTIKNPANSNWNAGASSKNILKSNTDGWVEFTIDDLGSIYMIGLSYEDRSIDYKEIDFAAFVKADGIFGIFESGVNRGNISTVNIGDVFRVAREATYIRYYQNGILLREVLGDPEEDLIVDMSIHSGGTPAPYSSFDQPILLNPITQYSTQEGANDGSISLTPSGGVSPYTFLWSTGETASSIVDKAPGLYTVLVSDANGKIESKTFNLGNQANWRNHYEVEVTSDNSVVKVGVDEEWNAGVSSFNVLDNISDGWFEFVVNDLGSTYMIGLSEQDETVDYTEIDYALYMHSGGVLNIFEGGANKGSYSNLIIGDTLRVSSEGDFIRYYLNSDLIREIQKVGQGNLLVDLSIKSGSLPSVYTSFASEYSYESWPGFANDIDEIQALRDLYNNTSGEFWTNHLGWPTSEAEWDAITSIEQTRDWYGITILNKDVVELNLFNNGLNGTLSASIGNLKGLELLQVNNNLLSGNIPETIGQLDRLELLYLHYNKFDGQIPSSLGALSNVVNLYLHVNKLTGAIPESFSGLTSLKNLYLNNNLLEGYIPAVLGDLISLRNLFLYNNRLTGSIPDTFRNLKNLIFLHLGNNALVGDLPSFLGELTQIHNLILYRN
ncbi:MAG: hypothetical protein AAFN93_12725, partial [Bacteroidota bacterium]